MGLTGAVDSGSTLEAAAVFSGAWAESDAIVVEVLVEETEEMVEVTEEEDDTDVSEVLPGFNSSCIVYNTKQASMGWAAAMGCDPGKASSRVG